MRLVGIALLAILIAACAPTAQTVRLAPAPPSISGDAGNLAIALEVVDTRADRTVGSLERMNGDDALIESASDPAYVIKLATAEALRRRGFRPGLWSDDAEPRVLIEIQNLNVRTDASLPHAISGEAALKIRAWQSGRRYTAEAKSSLTDIVATVPSPEENAEYLNTLVTRALRQALAPRLIDFVTADQTS